MKKVLIRKRLSRTKLEFFRFGASKLHFQIYQKFCWESWEISFLKHFNLGDREFQLPKYKKYFLYFFGKI